MSARSRFSDAERAALPVLPMLLVAWADGELTAAELDAVRSMLPAGGAGLGRWLDPAQPPSAADLHDLRGRLAGAAADAGLSAADRRGLAELGLAVARADAASSGAWSDTDGAALQALEHDLGIYGPGASARFFDADLDPSGDGFQLEPLPDARVAQLRALLDGPHAAWKDRTRAALADPRFRHPGELNTAAYRERVLAWLHDLVDAGLTGSMMPAASAGAPDLGAFAATFETLASFDLSLLVKFGVQFGLFGGSVLFLGSEAQRAEWLGPILRLELPGCFAMTERGHGSNVRDLETTADYVPERGVFVIDTPHNLAGKEWIGNAAAHGRMATVFARLRVAGDDHGVHAFLVPIRREDGSPMPRVRIADNGHKMGLNGVDNGRLWFDGVEVPRSALLSRFGEVSAEGAYASPIASPTRRFFTMLAALVGGRVCVAAASSTVAASALTIALRYGARRRQFGPEAAAETPILAYPTHQRRLIPRLARVIALKVATQGIVARWASVATSDDDARELEALAAGLKVLASRHATDTVQECREACGGQGYAAVNRFAALKADSDVFTTFEGDNTVLMQLVAKSVLGAFKAKLSDPLPLALVRHVAQRAATALAEKNPVIRRLHDSEHLRDGAFHRDLLAARVEELTDEVARGFKATLDAGADPFDALLRWQMPMVDLAHAWMEAQVHGAMRDAVEGCDDPALQALLNDLCDLHVLTHLDDQRGWFLERGYLSAAKSRALGPEVEALCASLAPQAVSLTDAFGLSPAVLGAPIAQ
jgi:acyl-CoA oxidase